MADEITFTIAGKSYKLSRAKVINAVKGLKSQRISKYAVKVDSKTFPPKQVLSEALGIPAIAFTTQYAYSILQRLDFEIDVVEN